MNAIIYLRFHLFIFNSIAYKLQFTYVLSKNDLFSVWSKFPCDFTYQHVNMTSFSTIDQFFVSESFLEHCVDAAPLHFAENRSNHSPIMLKLQLPEIIAGDQTKPAVAMRINHWHICRHLIWQVYIRREAKQIAVYSRINATFEIWYDLRSI